MEKNDTKADCFSDAQKAAFRFAEEAFRLIEVSDEVYAEATRFFGPQAITELLYVVGTYMLLAAMAGLAFSSPRLRRRSTISPGLVAGAGMNIGGGTCAHIPR